jgi:hypothetical protein
MKPSRFPLLTLEYLSLTAMLALCALTAGPWIASALLARVSQVCELIHG